jgi:hypothetical protein
MLSQKVRRYLNLKEGIFEAARFSSSTEVCFIESFYVLTEMNYIRNGSRILGSLESGARPLKSRFNGSQRRQRHIGGQPEICNSDLAPAVNSRSERAKTACRCEISLGCLAGNSF